MNYAMKRSREEEACDNNKNTIKKKSLSEKKKEINAAEINIGFECYKCGQCNFQTLHKKSLVHHNSFAHNIKLLNVGVKKQSEEKIDVTVEDQTKDIIIDEGPLMSGVIVEDQFENNMEDEESPGDEQIDTITIANSQQIKNILHKKPIGEKLRIDDVKMSQFCNSDSDTLNETMSSLPDISRSNSMERKNYSTSSSKSSIENDQSVEILDMGELFPHLIKDMSDESRKLPVDIDSPKSLRKHSLELSHASKEENQFIEDTSTGSIGLTPICSETDLSQSSSATHEEILPMLKREEDGQIINNEPRIKREEAGEIIKNEERVKGEEAEEIIKNEPRLKREIIKNNSKKVKNEPRIKREECGVIYSACPLCFKHWMMEELELHASECLGGAKDEIILDGTGEEVKDGTSEEVKDGRDGTGEEVKDGTSEEVKDGTSEEVKDGRDGTERFLCGYCSTSVHEGEDEKQKHLISCRKNMAMKKWQEARQEKKNALRSRYKKEV